MFKQQERDDEAEDNGYFGSDREVRIGSGSLSWHHAGHSGGGGGRGGGGQGGQFMQLSVGHDGKPHSGGGGGGGSAGGGSGGSGIVIARYPVALEEAPYLDFDAFKLADPVSGSTRFTSSDTVSLVDVTVPEGYDRVQLTAASEPGDLLATWQSVASRPTEYSFEPPATDGAVECYLWFTNSSSAVKLQRSRAVIYYTEAPPVLPVRPTVRRYLRSGGVVEVALSDFTKPEGGLADGRQMELLSQEIILLAGPGSDLTPEDPALITLNQSGTYSLLMRLVNEANVTLDQPFAVVLAPLPGEQQVLFSDNFRSGAWSDSDEITGFWSRSLTTVVAQQMLDTYKGRLINYISSGSENNKLHSLNSAPDARFNFSDRTITLEWVDMDMVLSKDITSPDWRFGVGFGKKSGMRIDKATEDSINFSYKVTSSSLSLYLYANNSTIASTTLTGSGDGPLRSNYSNWRYPVNFTLTVGPSEAVVLVELTDGTTRELKGVHGFDPASDDWLAAPALNVTFFVSSRNGADNPMGYTLDSMRVTTPRGGTVLLLR